MLQVIRIRLGRGIKCIILKSIIFCSFLHTHGLGKQLLFRCRCELLLGKKIMVSIRYKKYNKRDVMMNYTVLWCGGSWCREAKNILLVFGFRGACFIFLHPLPYDFTQLYYLFWLGITHKQEDKGNFINWNGSWSTYTPFL